jgi:hypothetical protein
MSQQERSTISVLQGTYEPCEECGAPLDPQQRYCVNCAARRANGANPSSRYFAAMSKKARRPPAKAGPGNRAAAVGFFALLPIAVALGVVVGRGGSGGSDDEALLQALRRQDAAVVASSAGTATAATAKTARKAGRAGKAPAKGGGKVVAQTENGTVHQVAGFKASAEKTAEDTQIVAENPEQTGDDYIRAQQNLPDVTVIGGDPGAAPAPSSGVEP